MKLFSWTAIVSLLTSLTGALGEEIGPVVVVPVRTEISSAQFFFLRRALKDAEGRQASAVILDMDTFGGDAQAAIDSMDALLKTSVPTYTFVNNKAISAGAMIALATQKIYMAPTAVIGAAAPVLASGQDLAKTMADKAVSMLSAVARAASQKNGHNPDIAEAFIHKEKELKVGGVIIDSADTLLTLSAEEAATYYDGKPLLAAGISNSLEEMLKQADLTGKIERLEPSGFEQIALWVTALSPLLLLGGIIGAYIEMKTPGFGIAGAVSLVCFALFFAGHYIAGLSGWEVAACFIVGLALVLGELLLHPGTIVPGLLGALLMLGAVIWAMIDRYPSQPLWPSEDMLVRPLMNLSIAIVAAGVIIAVLVQYLPKSPLYRHLALVTTEPSGGDTAVPQSARGIFSGMSGHAKTTLRPSGKAEFDGHIVDVVSEGEFIEAGAPIRVVTVEGVRVVVEAG
jgi:membrane-bound serine protease (ClpP class)